MCPLENQVDFSVPELLEKKTSEETVEHKDAEVTESAAGMLLCSSAQYKNESLGLMPVRSLLICYFK